MKIEYILPVYIHEIKITEKPRLIFKKRGPQKIKEHIYSLHIFSRQIDDKFEEEVKKEIDSVYVSPFAFPLKIENRSSNLFGSEKDISVKIYLEKRVFGLDPKEQARAEVIMKGLLENGWKKTQTIEEL